MDISRFARVPLGHFPTPLEPLFATRHSPAGLRPGQRVFVKRDDCTGLAFGGNKVRKLEFALATPAARAADTLVTCGSFQSNHVRQTAAAAARLGLSCHAVLSPAFPDSPPGLVSSGNRLLDELLGATLHIATDDGAATEALVGQVTERLRVEGRRPFFVPLGASTGVGALGYVACAQELLRQCGNAGVDPTHVVLATGSAGTQAGLLQGLRLCGSKAAVIGVSVSEPSSVKCGKVRQVLDELAQVLGPGAPAVDDGEIVVQDRYVGAGYAIPTREAGDAIELLARAEGLLLDPVYTGKAMAGLLDLVGTGGLEAARDIIFLHSGGAPALFAYQGARGA